MKTKMKKKTFTVLLGISALAFVASTGAAVYSANAEGEVEQPVLIMQTGAAIRTFAPTGIRFVSEISKTDYETLTAKNAEFCTLIIPEKLVPEGGITADNYKTVDAERVQAKNSIVEGKNTVTFSGTLVGKANGDGTYEDYFPDTAYNMALTAVSYYTYTENEVETVVFANNPQTYSVAYIASVLQVSGMNDPYYTKITDTVLSEGLSFAAQTYELYQGDTIDTVLDSKGLKVVYASDNEDIVTVTAAGKIFGVKAGTANISATIGNKTTSVAVTVKTPIELTGTYDVSLAATESSITPSQTIKGTIKKVEAKNAVITDGVSFADGKLTFTKEALQTLLGEKKYVEALEIEIFADERYTATINIATMFIDSAEDLTAITAANTAATIDAYYIVTKDIDAKTAGVVRFVNNDTLANDEVGFKGIFDGRGHIISNLKTAATEYNGLGGLFGMLQKGSAVKNAAFTNVSMNSEYKYVLSGESRPFYGTIENVVITAADGITLDRVVAKLSGGTMKNCLFVGFAQINTDTGVTAISNIMSVTVETSYGGFSWTGNVTYDVQPNYADVNAMFAALEKENKLQNWGDITYKAGAIYFGSTEIIKPRVNVSYDSENSEIARGSSVTFTTDGYAQISLKEEIEGVSVQNNVLSVGEAVAENTQITVVVTSTLNGNVTKEITFTVIRAYENVTIENELDFSLENENSSVKATIDGNIERIVVDAIEVRDGVEYNDGTLTLTKTALTALLNGKSYAENLTINIYTSTDKKYTATINIATMFIDSTEDLKAITAANTAATIDAYYIVTKDIDAKTAGVVRFVNNDTLANDEVGFKGIFDGRGHIISNLKTAATEYNGLGGLFGMLQKGSAVKNAAFTNVSMNSEYKYVLSGESRPFYGTIENVVITAADGITLDRVVAKLSGGTMKNCLFVGFAQINTDTGVTAISNIMSVTVETSYGGFSWTGNVTYDVQPNYADVNAMFAALEKENKLQNWGDITYKAGAIYFGNSIVIQNAAA